MGSEAGQLRVLQGIFIEALRSLDVVRAPVYCKLARPLRASLLSYNPTLRQPAQQAMPRVGFEAGRLSVRNVLA